MSDGALLGVVLGLLTAFFLGFFMVPRAYARQDTLTFLVGMTAGAAAGGALYWLARGAPFVFSLPAFVSIIPGLSWASGTFGYAYGTEKIGLAKATGIKNTQVVVTVMGGFLLFGEVRTTNPFLAVLGTSLVVATAVVLSRAQHRSQAAPKAGAGGYLMCILASLLYGANGIVMKWILGRGVSAVQMTFLISAGAVAGGVSIYFIVRRRLDFLKRCPPRDHIFAFSGGLIWAAALVTMILAIDLAGVAVAWSLMNLSVLVSVLYGVVILREVDLKATWRTVAAGLALACLGVLSLYLSKVIL